MTAHAERGFTLTEVLLASVVAMAAVGAVNALMYTTVRVEHDIRRRSEVTQETAAALAIVHIAKRIEAADRIKILPPPRGVQLRIPPEDFTQLDAPAAYHWERYARDAASGELQYFPDGGCNNAQVLAREITSASFVFRDEGLPAPGGPCFSAGDDCNLVEYAIEWDNGLAGADHKTHAFRTEIASRLVAESNVDSRLRDSGNQLSATSLEPPDVSGC